jgi:hypothetical protein
MPRQQSINQSENPATPNIVTPPLSISFLCPFYIHDFMPSFFSATQCPRKRKEKMLGLAGDEEVIHPQHHTAAFPVSYS